MEVLITDERLAKLLNSQPALVSKFGSDPAKFIQRRMTELRHAMNVEELQSLPGKWHRLVGDRNQDWSCRVSGRFRLIIRAVEPVPRDSSGREQWELVDKVDVVEIGGYHR